MERRLTPLVCYLLWCFSIACIGCHNQPAPSKETIAAIRLKTGPVITCGPADQQLGLVDFATSCGYNQKKDFNTAMVLLHSFEYDEAEKVFAKIITAEPTCAMAYWGVAMCNFHALWTPPAGPELSKGSKAIAAAQSIPGVSGRESAYINALAVFYKDPVAIDHHMRCMLYKKAMEKVYRAYPDDKEAAILYALALDAAADPADKSFANQKKAGAILNALYPSQPDHPGIIHYIIHTYDYPGLAITGLSAARAYAKVAPSSAHALHMPSHIFTRLGLWDEAIRSNLASVASAKCYAEQAGIKGHWDEELHGLDYLVYAYLQQGNNELAEKQLQYLQTFTDVSPVNFKVAYSFAAVPARIALENKRWKDAAALELYPVHFPWAQFPWQEAIVHFANLLGAVHIGDQKTAGKSMTILEHLHDTLVQQKDAYKANQVAIQITGGQAWILYKAGDKVNGIKTMTHAAAMEDSTEKHPVTPGEILPQRELLADMLMEDKQYAQALLQYETVLQKSPNRFNSVYGAGIAAEKSGDKNKAASYYRQLLTFAKGSDRVEVAASKNKLPQ